MKKIWEKVRFVLPIPAAILFVLFVVALVVESVSRGNPALADWVSETTGTPIRAALSYMTSFLPFSFAEFLLIASPILLILLCVWIARRVARSAMHGLRAFVSLLSVISLVYSLFVFGYGTGYYGKSIDARLSLERRKLSASELYDTTLLLIDQIEKDLPFVPFPENTYSAMPYTYFEMNDKLLTAYDTLSEKFPSIQRLHVPTKPVMLSEPWTYTHISGVYCFFTGEANVNTNYPDFIVASSAAHEMAHQRGITKEDEANFIAFLVASVSDDAYIRYSGYADVLNSVLGKLYAADSALYADAYSRMPDRLKKEYQYYGLFFTKYQDSTASKVSGAINDAYITTHNQPAGVQSYGLVVDLVVAYMLQAKGE